MKKIIGLLWLNFISLSLVSAQEKNTTLNTHLIKLDVQINTSDNSLKLNGLILKIYDLKEIEKMIGKPDRIKTHTFNSHYEEFGTKNIPPRSTPIKVTNYYYIYDKLGIMFYTNNGFSKTKKPEKFSIHFKNKRTFTHTATLPFTPKHFFKGTLTINGETVVVDRKAIADNVNYQTENINLYNVLFGSTSITTIIDGLYTQKSEPYMFLLLNNEKEQRISYMVINETK